MEKRPICTKCKKKFAAVNYRKGEKVYYRKMCDSCNRNHKKKGHLSTWAKAGYKKKTQCEKCGFEAKFYDQLEVYYLDGNMINIKHTNLKTVCLNCLAELGHEGWNIKQGDLIPDL
jgi:hypothetical protein